MGLISRVSSRTYRIRGTHYSMLSRISNSIVRAASAAAAAPAVAGGVTRYGQTLSVEVKDNGVAVITMDDPAAKVNSLGKDMMDNFPALFSDLSNNDNVSAILLRSNKKGCFVAGADIQMLNAVTTREDALAISTGGQAIFEQIETSSKPVVAALNGACLGGGLELALACHYRIALDAKATKIGLPEVMLGLLPGAGGTQRLPKLIGLDKAMPLVLQGKQLNAKRAQRQGIVNQVVSPLGPGIVTTEEDFDKGSFDVASQFAAGTLQKPRPKEPKLPTKIVNAACSIGPLREKFFETQVLKGIYKATAGVYPAPLKIAEVFKETCANPDEGYKLEAEGFADLVMTPESKACIHLFNGQNHCKKNKYGKKQKRKAIGVMEKHAIMNRLSLQTDYAGFENADMVIEAVFEDINVKHNVVREVEQHVPEHCIVATNTSALSITEIAKASKRPDKIVGMHYFSPVDKMMLLEIIPGEKTSDDTLAAASAVGIKQGKLVVVVKECAGFFANRCLGPCIGELTRIMQEGTDPEELNKLATSYGFPVGLATLMDEVGIDVAHTVGKYLHGAYGERMEGGNADMFDEIVEAGLLGKKTKKGIFEHTGKKLKKGAVTPEVKAILEKYKTEAPAKFSKEDLQHRIVLRFVNEAVMTLEEGIIQSA